VIAVIEKKKEEAKPPETQVPVWRPKTASDSRCRGFKQQVASIQAASSGQIIASKKQVASCKKPVKRSGVGVRGRLSDPDSRASIACFVQRAENSKQPFKQNLIGHFRKIRVEAVI